MASVRSRHAATDPDRPEVTEIRPAAVQRGNDWGQPRAFSSPRALGSLLLQDESKDENQVLLPGPAGLGGENLGRPLRPGKLQTAEGEPVDSAQRQTAPGFTAAHSVLEAC